MCVCSSRDGFHISSNEHKTFSWIVVKAFSCLFLPLLVLSQICLISYLQGDVLIFIFSNLHLSFHRFPFQEVMVYVSRGPRTILFSAFDFTDVFFFISLCVCKYPYLFFLWSTCIWLRWLFSRSF